VVEGTLRRKTVSFAPEVEACEALRHLRDGHPDEALTALHRGGNEAVTHALNSDQMSWHGVLQLLHGATENSTREAICDWARALPPEKRAALLDVAARQGDTGVVETLSRTGLLGALPPAGEVALAQKNFVQTAFNAHNTAAALALLRALPEGARGELARAALQALLAEGHSALDSLIADAFSGADKETATALLAKAPAAFAQSVARWAQFARRPDIVGLAQNRAAAAATPPLQPMPLGVKGIEALLETALRERDATGTLSQAVGHLLGHQAGVKRSDTARHAVIVAALCGNVAQLQRLKAGGVSLELTDAQGDTTLLRMARGNNHAATQALLLAGADPNARDTLQRTALHLAATRGDEPLIDLLLAAGAQKDAVCHPNLGSKTPLEMVPGEKFPGCVAKLKGSGSQRFHAPENAGV
jgi:hypothetical protein